MGVISAMIGYRHSEILVQTWKRLDINKDKIFLYTLSKINHDLMDSVWDQSFSYAITTSTINTNPTAKSASYTISPTTTHLSTHHTKPTDNTFSPTTEVTLSIISCRCLHVRRLFLEISQRSQVSIANPDLRDWSQYYGLDVSEIEDQYPQKECKDYLFLQW